MSSFFTDHPIADIYDAYVHSNGKVYLIDISPFDEAYSEPILFSWDELKDLSKDGSDELVPELRIIETETNIMPNLRRMATALPFDLVQPERTEEEEAALEGVDPNNIEALVEKLKNLTKAAEKLNEESSNVNN